MENEFEGSSVPPSSKQAFIYKKNPTSTAKAITRKMRPSHAPLEPQNSAGGDSAYRTGGGQSRFDGARSSHNDAETIATHGQRSHVSPSSKALSQGHFGNMDSSGALGSTGALRQTGPQGDNRRFTRGMGGGGSAGRKNQQYEDNIDSETEVFIDPQIENKLVTQARRTEMHQKRSAARELFPSGDEQPNNYMNKKPHRRTQQNGEPLSADDHFKAIDAVINSNVDDKTKQRLIADIQEKYRQSQRAAEANKGNKPKNQKQYTKEDQLLPDHQQRRHRGNDSSIEAPGSGQYHPHQGRAAKQQRQIRGRKQPDDHQDHQNFLMPEMNEFIDDNTKRNYLTQDEMGGDPRLNKGNKRRPKNQNWAESEDNDDLVTGKIQHFTPGRIRASRMGKSNAPGDYTNSKMSQGDAEYMNQTQGARPRRKKPQNPNVESVDRDDSLQSVEDPTDYNQILPAVKLRPKKKKKHRSPSDHSPGENSINGLRGRNHSMSRISNHARDPKLRPTLDQGLHFQAANVKVPAKQTHFYDDKHGANITDQQLQTWKVKNGKVMLDQFHAGQKPIPVNRHRIPAIGDEKVFVGSGAPRRGPPGRLGSSPDNFLWDMDGRRHKKPKQPKPQRAITQNASHRKVDLPRIQQSQPNLLSPNNGTNSQPTGLGRRPQPPGKFIGRHDKRIKKLIPPPTNDESGQLDLIDIDIKTAPEPPRKFDRPVPDPEPREPSEHYDPGPPLEEQPQQPEPQPEMQEPEIDPQPYFDHVERQRHRLQKKSKGKVVVEDDYVKPEDFRDPGGRKNKQSERHDSGTKLPKSKKSRGSEYGQDKSKSPTIRRDSLSNDRSNKSIGRGSVEKLQSQTESAKFPSRSPHNSNNNGSRVPPRSNTEETDRSPGNGDPVGSFEDKTPKGILKDGIHPDSFDDRTPKGILKDGNKEPSTTPNQQKSRDGTRNGSKLVSGHATQSAPMNHRELTSGDQHSRPKITDSHSRSNAFKSDDRIRSHNKNPRDDPDISIGSREHMPPQTEQAHDLNDSMDKGGSGPHAHGRYDGQDSQVKQHTVSRDRSVSNDHTVSKDPHTKSKGDKDRDYDPKFGKHLHSSNDVTEPRKRNDSQDRSKSGYDGPGEVKLNKIKSQTAASQVRFAYGTADSLVDDRQNAPENPKVTSSQIMQRGKLHGASSMEPGHHSQTNKVRKQRSEFSAEGHDQGYVPKKKKSSPDGKRGRSITKSQTGDMKSVPSSGGKKFGRMYFPDDKSGGRSATSKSPEARRVMGMLTHHRVKIDQQTKLLINGSEILTQEGIKGNIKKVGVGFGTGRHTSGRRLDLLKEVPVAVQKTMKKEQIQTLDSPVHRQPVRMDAQTQHQEPEVQSEGCDPISPSLKSEKVSAHVSGRDLGLSARTQTVQPDRESIGVSAKPISEISVREQGDQVTEGRFEPTMVDTHVNTDGRLLEDYLSKPKVDSGTNTAPVIFGEERPVTYSALIQTEPMVKEMGMQDEPVRLHMSYEPETAKINHETGSQSSVLDEPICDTLLELVLPPEPTTEEDDYVDDWADSQLYKYAYELHYDHMIKKKLISETLVVRPVPPPEQEGMNKVQKYEHNLNPEGLSILSYMECDYGQAALRHKSATYKSEETLQDLYTRAKTTIKVLNANMVRPDICDRLLFTHYSEVTSKNVIKLLLRVKRLYDARNESVNILKLVMEVEAVIFPKSDLWRILGDNSRSPLKKSFRELLERTLQILSNALMRITIFQQEHHLFKDEFKFNKREYRDYLRDIGKIIGGFLKMKGQPNPALQETGLLQEQHDEHVQQTERYQEWVNDSLQEYGRLDMPDEAEIEQIQPGEKKEKKLKGSRIDKALNKLHEEQKLRSEQESSQFELTSKSKILHQMQVKQVQLEVQKQNSGYAAMNAEWQKTSISDQMIERKQESERKRDRIAREQEDQRRRQEKRDRGEDSVSQISDNTPLKLTDLQMHQCQRSEISQEYSQINVGRYNFAPSDISHRQPSIHMRDEAQQPVRHSLGLPLLQSGYGNRNKSNKQMESISGLDSDRISPTNQTHQHNQFNKNSDYVDGIQSNDKLMQNSSTPSMQTVIQKAPLSNLPFTFGKPDQANAYSMMEMKRMSRASNEVEDDQTEFTEQQDAESEHIGHELENSLNAIPNNINLLNDSQNVIDDSDDGQTINSTRHQEYQDSRSNLRILNQGQIKIKYQESQNSNPFSKQDSFNDRQ